MNRSFHIFRKDVIRLWPQISAFVALLAANAWTERWYPRDAPNQQTLLVCLTLLLPVACSVLLIALIHEERLVGDRQYWLSRPIPRRELIAAKILFTLVFVNLPVFLYQAVMVVSGGLPLFRNWPNFFCLQLFFTAIDILPIVALASVTRTMVQAVLAALAAALAAMGLITWISSSATYSFVSWPTADTGLVWISATLAAAAFAVGSVAVLVRQYHRRGTMLSRTLLIGTAALAICTGLLPHSTKWAIQMKVSPENIDPKDFRISWPKDGRFHSGRGQTSNGGPVSLELPIEIDQPAGLSVHAEAYQGSVAGPSGDSWRVAGSPGGIRADGDAYYMTVGIDRAFYNRVKDTPVHFYGVFELTVLANGRALSIPVRRLLDVPGIGVCGEPPRRVALIACNSMLPRARIQLIEDGRPDGGSATVLAPYAYSFGYSPTSSIGVSLPGQLNAGVVRISLLLQRPIAYIERPFDFGNIILGNYEAANENDLPYLP